MPSDMYENNKGRNATAFHTFLFKAGLIVALVGFTAVSHTCPSCETPVILELTDEASLRLTTGLDVDPIEQLHATYGGFVLRAELTSGHGNPSDCMQSHSYEIDGDQVIYYADLSDVEEGVAETDLVVSLLRRTPVEDPVTPSCSTSERSRWRRMMSKLVIPEEVAEEILVSFDAGEPSIYQCRPGGVEELTFEADFEEMGGGPGDGGGCPGSGQQQGHGVTVDVCVADVAMVGDLFE